MDDTLLEGFDEYAAVARTIGSYVSSGIVTVEATATLREAAGVIDRAGVGCVVVGTQEQVEGVVSERDIVRAVAAGVDLDDVTVAEVETKQLKWATPESSVDDVAAEMLQNYVRHVMVGDDDGLAGIVSMRDLLGAFLD